MLYYNETCMQHGFFYNKCRISLEGIMLDLVGEYTNRIVIFIVHAFLFILYRNSFSDTIGHSRFRQHTF